MSSIKKSLAQVCSVEPLERNSIVKLVLFPTFNVPSYLRQLAIPAPHIELGTSPVFTGFPILWLLLSINCTRMFGLIASVVPHIFSSSRNKFKI